MLTAYDALFGRLADEAGADLVLVGESLGNVVLGFETTLSVTLDDMVRATGAVARGVSHAMVVADLPFGTYGGGFDTLLHASVQLMRAGAQAVKLEGAHTRAIADLVAVGIPVMAHLGFTPQSVNTLGGHRAQGREPAVAARMNDDLAAVTEAGAFATVLELVPAHVAEILTKDNPDAITIGIGAGAGCHGQVQVMHDVLGLGPGYRHAKAYGDGLGFVRTAFADYVNDVRAGRFPTAENAPKDPR